MRITELEIDGPILVRLTGTVLDRPVLELQVRRLAAEPRMDLQARSKEDLAQALIVFARKQKSIDQVLGKELLKATALERQRLLQMGEDWEKLLVPAFEQKRTGSKFLMAMLLSPPPWPERGRAYTAAFVSAANQRAEVMTHAEQGGVKDTLVKLEQEFAAAHRRSSALEQKVAHLEHERAAVVAQLGQREALLKHVGHKAQLLERELSSARKVLPAATSQETEELKRKLRRLEKQAAFARDRERDREALQRVERERDMLLKELHVLRLQVQVAQVASLVKGTGAVVRPAPGSVAATASVTPTPRTQSGIYVDGANVSAIARKLYNRKVSFEALRELLAERGETPLLKAYVVDTGSEGFDAYLRSLKLQGYAVFKRTPKRLPDGSAKADMDVQLAVDVMADQPGPTRVVLVTGDSDFVPLVKTLRQRGVRVEAAMFRERAANELIDAVDAFWSLDESVLI